MMATIRQFIIEDVRCFAGRQDFDIRPLTLLVGENSTGKSTLLGCYHTLMNAITERRLDFNIEPYQMGAFDNIVRRTARGQGRLRSGFTLGYGVDIDRQPVEVLYQFGIRGSEPSVDTIEFLFSDGGRVVFRLDDDAEDDRRFRVAKESDTTFMVTLPSELIVTFGLSELLAYAVSLSKVETRVAAIAEPITSLINMVPVKSLVLDKEAIESRNDLVTLLEGRFGETNDSSDPSVYRKIFDLGRSVSLAPIRAKPKRTYDPLTEAQSPEGDEVPMYLMRLSRTEPDKWRELQQRLQAFGESSGLFDGIFVRNFGRSMSDPFQLEVKIRGRKTNIMDVGYGISQLLPILVRILQGKEGQTFLLQQPEVHLHPSGRAAFASLLVQSVGQNNRFIVETHSDYLVDRTRICIRKGEIAADDVSLIYFEPKEKRVRAHNIGFDDAGNLLNVPESYQDFFLKESKSLLGFDEA